MDTDDILESSDLFEVVEALLDAKDKAYELGLTLQLPPVEVKSICSHRKDPQDRLTGIIEYALKQVKPKPTWRGIVTALRSPIVDEPVLAARVELDKIPPSSLAGSVDRETEDSDVRRRVGVVEEEVVPKARDSIKEEKKSGLSQKSEFPIHYIKYPLLLVAVAIVAFLVVGYLKQHNDTTSEVFSSSSVHHRPESTPGARTTANQRETPITDGNIEGRLSQEPTIKELQLIRYKGSNGEEKTFRLISEIQNDCRDLGTHLGIDEPTLMGLERSLSSSHSLTEVCKAILQTWINRGGETVTWAGLIQALNDDQLGGISRRLREALT